MLPNNRHHDDWSAPPAAQVAAFYGAFRWRLPCTSFPRLGGWLARHAARKRVGLRGVESQRSAVLLC